MIYIIIYVAHLIFKKILTYISDILIQILPWIILDYRLYVYWINRVNCEYLKHENYISIPNIHIIDSYAIIVLYITLISKIMCMVVIKIVCCCIHNLLQLSIIYEIKLWKSIARESVALFFGVLWILDSRYICWEVENSWAINKWS